MLRKLFINEARLFLNLAIKLWERCIQPTDPRLALAYADVAALEYNFGNGWAGWGSKEGKQALQLLAKISEIQPHFLVSCFNKLALISGLPKIERVRLAQRVEPFVLRGAANVDDVLPFVEFLLFGSSMKLTDGNFDGVRGGINLALRYITMIQNSPTEPLTALAFRGIGVIEKTEGNLVKARDNILQAINIQEQLFDPYHVELGESYAALAEVEEALDHAAEARTRWTAAAKIGMAVWFPWGQLEKWTSWNLKAAKGVRLCGHLDAARALLDRIVTAFGGLKALGSSETKTDPQLMRAYVALADVDDEEGKFDDAKTCLQKANEIAIQHYGQDHAETKQITHQLREVGCSGE